MGHIYEVGGIRDPKTGKLHKLTKKSLEKALELYKEAADQGCELALNQMGSIAYNMENDFNKAVKYFKLAS